MRTNYFYNVNQKPPITMQIMLGLQHCLGIASTLALPIIIFSAAGLAAGIEADLIAASMFAMGLGTILMSLNTKYVGSGFLCPLLCEPAFLMVSMVAIKQGGAPLFFGMMFLSALFQIFFAGVYPYIRRLFPTEVTGIVVLMVGLSLVKPDLVYSLGSASLDKLSTEPADLITTLATLGTMLFFVVWDYGLLTRYCLLVGVVVGFIVATWQGLLLPADYLRIWHAPLFSWSIPFTLTTMKFNVNLIIPFFIASIALTLKGIGGIINCQKINDANWIRPEQTSIRKGIFTNALANLLASLFGGVNLGVANNNIGLAVATRVTSRYVGIMTGILFVIFAFMPKIAMLFVIMPKPVIGATLVFVTSYVIVAGIEILSSRLLDTRKIFVIGLSLLAGMATFLHPPTPEDWPILLQPILASPIVVTTLVAIILNAVFSIGAYTKSELLLTSPTEEQEVHLFLTDQGTLWGATPQLIHDAKGLIKGALRELMTLGIKGPIKLTFTYTDYQLRIAMRYKGKPLMYELSQAELALAINVLRATMPELRILSKHDDKTEKTVITMHLIQ